MGATASLGRNLSRPEKGFYGWLAINVMKKKNTYLEINAARLCKIQPEYKVLEVGFGVGKGLENGSGVIYGTDISEKMREIAGTNLKKQIAAGKIILHPYSVEDMKFEDNMFDCVFHCNCHYFWPDMDKAVGELNRVMKPGAAIVTVFNRKRAEDAQNRGLMIGNIDPERYMTSLKYFNFTDVDMSEHKDTTVNDDYISISAKSPRQLK